MIHLRHLQFLHLLLPILITKQASKFTSIPASASQVQDRTLPTNSPPTRPARDHPSPAQPGLPCSQHCMLGPGVRAHGPTWQGFSVTQTPGWRQTAAQAPSLACSLFSLRGWVPRRPPSPLAACGHPPTAICCALFPLRWRPAHPPRQGLFPPGGCPAGEPAPHRRHRMSADADAMLAILVRGEADPRRGRRDRRGPGHRKTRRGSEALERRGCPGAPRCLVPTGLARRPPAAARSAGVPTAWPPPPPTTCPPPPPGSPATTSSCATGSACSPVRPPRNARRGHCRRRLVARPLGRPGPAGQPGCRTAWLRRGGGDPRRPPLPPRTPGPPHRGVHGSDGSRRPPPGKEPPAPGPGGPNWRLPVADAEGPAGPAGRGPMGPVRGLRARWRGRPSRTASRHRGHTALR